MKVFDIDKEGYLLFCPEDPSLFKIDPIVKDILDIGKNGDLNSHSIQKKLSRTYKKKDILGAIKEIALLKGRGFLQSEKPSDFKRQERKAGIRGLELHLSNDCNLACTHCFAQGGDYGYKTSRKNMDWALAKRSIDWLFNQNRNNQEALAIQFFGGEPLLNIGVLERCLRYIKENPYGEKRHFIEKTIGTNGTLLNDEAIGILKRYNCVPLISLDASFCSHDSRRPYKNGRPSFNDTYNAIKRLKQIAPRLPLIICTTLDLKDDLKEIVGRQKDLKTDHVSIKAQFSLYEQGKVSRSAYNSFLKRIKETLEKSYRLSLRKKKAFNFLTPSMFYHLHSGRDSYAGCGAGMDKLAVNAEGNVFMCSIGLGEETKIGKISEKGLAQISRSKVKEFYRSGSREKNLECNYCWVRKLCKGICVLSLERASNTPGENRVCDFTRTLSEFSLKSYASMGYDDALRLFGLHKNTKDVLKKIMLLYGLRDINNSRLKHIKHITPCLNPVQG